METPGHRNVSCSNGPGHMTKMAAMTIYAKKLLQNWKANETWDLICSIGDVGPT